MSKKKPRLVYVKERLADGTRREFGSVDAGMRRIMLMHKLSKAGLSPSEIIGEVRATEQAARASRPRADRKPRLRVRALARALREVPTLTATALLDRLDADGAWTIEPDPGDDPGDDEIELARDGNGICVRDLGTGETDTIPAKHLGTYMDRARHT